MKVFALTDEDAIVRDLLEQAVYNAQNRYKRKHEPHDTTSRYITCRATVALPDGRQEVLRYDYSISDEMASHITVCDASLIEREIRKSVQKALANPPQPETA